jgi:hypothetical protein
MTYGNYWCFQKLFYKGQDLAFHLNNRIFTLCAALISASASGSSMAQSPLENLLIGMKKIAERSERASAALKSNQQFADSSGSARAGFASVEGAEEPQATPTKISLPKDRKMAAAVDEAMPLIKKIVSMHRCMKNNGALRQWNFDAVPGVDMTSLNIPGMPKLRLPIEKMQYHDNNRCLNANVIDQFSMPADNALSFRAVYFASDSGETANFSYLFIKTDDGWKIKQFQQG